MFYVFVFELLLVHPKVGAKTYKFMFMVGDSYLLNLQIGLVTILSFHHEALRSRNCYAVYKALTIGLTSPRTGMKDACHSILSEYKTLRG